MIIRYGSDDPFKVKHTADWVPLPAGQRIMYDYGGGGGWGDPLDRDPQAVLDDVLDEYVSVEGARPRLRRRAVRLARGPHARGRRGRHRGPPRAGDRAPGSRRDTRERWDTGSASTSAARSPTCVCVTPDGDVVLDKTLTTVDDQSIGVMNGLTQLAERFGVSARPSSAARMESLVHGTTSPTTP